MEDKNQIELSITTLVKVRFWGNPRVHTFKTTAEHIQYNQCVIAPSDKGLDLGIISSFPFQKKVDPKKYQSILRAANAKDFEHFNELKLKAKSIKTMAMKYVEKLNLNMTISHVTVVDSPLLAVIYFTSNERVDFREILKLLRRELSLKIELCHLNKHEQEQAVAHVGGCGHTGSDFVQFAGHREKNRILKHYR